MSNCALGEVVAYWDNGSCGPKGADHNWAWCNKKSGGGCQVEVTTNECPSGLATLRTVHGDQYATSMDDQYVLDDCTYAYYAIYDCKEGILS